MSKIISCHCNRVDMLEIQIISLLKRCKDLEEIIIVNDGIDEETRNEIRKITLKYNQTCWDAPRFQIREPSIRVSNLLQWSYERFLRSSYKGKIAVFDGDVFPLSDFNISDYVNEEKTIAGIKQTRGHVFYLWPGFVFINLDKLKNFEDLNWGMGVIENNPVDTGGNFYYYFKENGIDKINWLNHTEGLRKDTLMSINIPQYLKDRYNFSYRMEVLDNKFLHYGSVSGWNNPTLEDIKNKTDFFIDWLKSTGL